MNKEKTTPLSEKGRCKYCGEKCGITDWILEGLCPRCSKFKQALKNFYEELKENIQNEEKLWGIPDEVIFKLIDEAKLKHFGEGLIE